MRLLCQSCGKTGRAMQWRCTCGGLFDLCFEAELCVDALPHRPPTLWRYREAIPIEDDAHQVTLGEGFTPLTPVSIAGKSLLVKQDHLFPSGSYKDRGATVLISHAKALGVHHLVEDSSGNAGAGIAAYAARAGMTCDIYVPDSTSAAKLAQIQSYGATLYKIPGAREDTARAVQDAARKHFYASHVWNPFFFHGTKTYAYEIWEQRDFNAPDTLIIPTGNGTLLIGAYIGFTDLLKQNLIAHMPKLIAVQSSRCAPLADNWTGNPSATIAEGIAIAEPARAAQIAQCIDETGGEILTVDDEDTRNAQKRMAEMGFYIEPTSATAIAAYLNYPSQNDEIVVAPLTGHGLKTTGK